MHFIENLNQFVDASRPVNRGVRRINLSNRIKGMSENRFRARLLVICCLLVQLCTNSILAQDNGYYRCEVKSTDKTSNVVTKYGNFTHEANELGVTTKSFRLSDSPLIITVSFGYPLAFRDSGSENLFGVLSLGLVASRKPLLNAFRSAKSKVSENPVHEFSSDEIHIDVKVKGGIHRIAMKCQKIAQH